MATGLDLPPDALAINPIIENEATGAMMARIVAGVEATLIVSQQRYRELEKGEYLEVSPTLDSPIRTMISVPKLTAELGGADAPKYEGNADQGKTLVEQKPPNMQREIEPLRLDFDSGSRTVIFDGKRFPIKNPFTFGAFVQIYHCTCKEQYVTGKQLGRGRVDRRLRKWLPPELRVMLESRDGKGGGYISSLSRKSP